MLKSDIGDKESGAEEREDEEIEASAEFEGLAFQELQSCQMQNVAEAGGFKVKAIEKQERGASEADEAEIAQLLESGQDRTARIRVEHVIREEKMMAAYDLLEIYCELIVARLPIIESQKNCPIDLKEAIASLVFAAPRCGDVPELLDARKHFTAKYGKDFTTAAIELRPQCGVGRMLVEKLSATAPDGQAKMKILRAIAEEHNVKWDPESFEEKESIPPNDLLSGPSSLRKESELYAEPPHFVPAQVQAQPSNNMMHGSPLNFSQQDARTSVGAEKLVPAQTSGVSTPFQPEARPPALGDERAQGDWNTSPLDRRRWNMEFKDATSAAQAAAESAERASMAARAAAELSIHGRILRQYSTESHKSDDDILKDEGPETHPNSNFSRENFSEASVGRSSFENTRLQTEKIDGIKPNDLKIATTFKEESTSGSHEISQSAFLKSKASADDYSLDHGVPVVDEYSRKNSLKEVSEDEVSVKKQSLRYEAETTNRWPEKDENLREGRIGKQHSVSSSYSQSSISDDVNIFSNSEYQKYENDAVEDRFVGTGKTSIHGKAPQTSSHESVDVVFDKFDSDIDDHGFDKGPTYDEHELDFDVPSLDQKSPDRLSINADSWSPRSSSSKIVKSNSSLFFTREKSSPDLSKNMTLKNDSELDFAPVTFDESDGPTSESDEDLNTRHNNVGASRDPRKQDESGQSVRSQFWDKTGQSVGSSFKHEENSVFDSKNLSLSSDDELNSSTKMHWKRNQVELLDSDYPEKFSLVKPSAKQLGRKDSQMESKEEIDDESSSESGERLNFGKLTGGFRHKGHNHLPFVKNRLDVSSSVKKEAETTATSPPIERPEIDTMLNHKKSSRTQVLPSESDSDSSDEDESSQKNSGRKQDLPVLMEIKTTKSRVGASNSFFGSDNSDLDDDSPMESLTRKGHMRSGISRRTKASPSSSSTNSYSKTRLRSEALDSDAGMSRNSTTNSISETPKNLKHVILMLPWEENLQTLTLLILDMNLSRGGNLGKSGAA
ncbi:hypothetical protein DH2020_018689 [Rehmannia glutinosa]|uniref:Regulator of Vps4 activity in the MVB pathway protein n=1 Tax=Rehmannia glutinosa TaxID=99300 RepID=A0ABR0WN77_REHGL